jgi:hypothetical protein
MEFLENAFIETIQMARSFSKNLLAALGRNW